MRLPRPWAGRAQRRDVNAERERVWQLIDALAPHADQLDGGQATGSLDDHLLDTGTPLDVTVTVPWASIPQVRQIVAASSLPIGSDLPYALTAEHPDHWSVRIETRIPALTVAEHLAVAATGVDQQIRSGASEPRLHAYRTLREALVDDQGRGHAIGAVHAALTGRPFGHETAPSSADQTLAVLLLGNCAVPDEDLTTNLVGPALLHLSAALANTPELLDVAVVLEDDSQRSRVTVSPAHRSEPEHRSQT